jgi:hypothetical protein
MLGVGSFSGGFLPGEGGLSHVPYPPPMPPTGAWKHLCVVIRYKKLMNVKLKKKLSSTCPAYLVFRDDMPRHLHLTTPRTPPPLLPPLLSPYCPLPPPYHPSPQPTGYRAPSRRPSPTSSSPSSSDRTSPHAAPSGLPQAENFWVNKAQGECRVVGLVL